MPSTQLSALIVTCLCTTACGPDSSPDSGAVLDGFESTDAGPDLATGGVDLASDGAAMPDLSSTPDGGACNGIPNAAPVVQQVTVNQSMPSPTAGGTIMSGTYYLTDSKIYQGGGAPLQIQATQAIAGNVVQDVTHIGMAPNSTYDTRTYSTSGTTLTVTLTCGGSATFTFGFDATSTQYTTYNNTSKTVNVWSRQ
jgi:hypothetical protein